MCRSRRRLHRGRGEDTPITRGTWHREVNPVGFPRIDRSCGLRFAAPRRIVNRVPLIHAACSGSVSGGLWIRASRDHCPNARICADPFHVIKLANQAVDELRARAVATVAAGPPRREWVRQRTTLSEAHLPVSRPGV